MKEKGMIFTGESVRAILAGRKTQTRRIIKGVEPFEELVQIDIGLYRCSVSLHGWALTGPAIIAPYQVGQRVWVRETFCHEDAFYPERVGLEWKNWHGIRDGKACATWIDYKADMTKERWREYNENTWRWSSPLYMPRWASRIDLLITGVKAERVQDISEDDAYLEGITGGDSMGDPVGEYAKQWDTIHGPGAWDRNDWVFAYTFERVKP